MPAPENETLSGSFRLMSEMARPKPIAVRMEQFARLGKRASLAALVLMLCAAAVAVSLQLTGRAAGSLPSWAVLMLAEALLVLILGRSIQGRVQTPESTPPRVLYILNGVTNLILAGIPLLLGPGLALQVSMLPTPALEVIGQAVLGATCLILYFLGTMPSGFVLIASTPIAWLAGLAWARGGDVPAHLYLEMATLAAFLYPVALLWFRASARYARKGLIHQTLIRYLDNARQHTESLNQQLAWEIGQREQTEADLKAAQAELQTAVRERTRELEQANRQLSKQIRLRKSISDALVKSQHRLSQAIEATELALWDWDIPEGRVFQSPFHDAFGPSELSSEHFVARLRDILHPEDERTLRQALVRCLKDEASDYRVHYRVRTDNGWLWVEDCGKVVSRDEHGRATRMIGTRRDVTRDHEMDEQLRLAKTVFDFTAEGIFALDADFRFLTVNPAFTRITGHAPEDVLGKTLMEISGTPQREQVFRRICEALKAEGQWQGEIYEKRRSGDYYPQWMQLSAVRDDQGRTTLYAGIFIDSSERKRTDEQLHYLLNYDDLTGLTNRVQFKNRLHQALNQMREHFERYALMVLDVDRFRHVNESLGHDGGDALLKQVAQRLSALAQQAETLARLGNDEFAILQKVSNRAEAGALAQRILDALKVPFNVEGQEIYLAVSIGITLTPDNARELQTLLAQAQSAVRQAKYLGGNTFEFYSKMLQNLAGQRLSLESELRKALARNELEVYYQPKLNVRTQMIESVEALVRWHHPERGMISPAEFVPVAEESGLIMEIGEQVLRQACAQAVRWADQGLGDIRVAVNLSAYQFRQSHLVRTVRDILDETGLPPSQLDLELTESALMENLSRTTFTLSRFREMGIYVTVDDFGTGYSSLSYLKRFPINALKIDQMFIKDACTNPDDAAITRAIILLGQSLNLEVVAEGVENQEHISFLKRCGCHTLQGYFISPPLSTQRLSELLHRQLSAPLSVPAVEMNALTSL
ncbi:EAL domain-containing protein [Hahella sp. SMD15-11]|uniref:cyclic-guanylate-specific phosphodiesterase n=1 Tax=Thermohahella caldifontis TaxID=3142973 RepID=A0AB39URM6_9GAMM